MGGFDQISATHTNSDIFLLAEKGSEMLVAVQVGEAKMRLEKDVIQNFQITQQEMSFEDYHKDFGDKKMVPMLGRRGSTVRDINPSGNSMACIFMG